MHNQESLRLFSELLLALDSTLYPGIAKPNRPTRGPWKPGAASLFLPFFCIQVAGFMLILDVVATSRFTHATKVVR